MAAIEFTTHDGDTYTRVGDLANDETAAKLSPGELDSVYRSHHPGAEDRLQLFEVRAPANATFNAHSHDEDEIILVVDGELRAGSHVIGPGGSMYVSGGTVYSFRAGPEGLRFFNFRPRLDATYRTPAETRASTARS
jgi:quercetin dioxygenase-like cupin family protein